MTRCSLPGPDEGSRAQARTCQRVQEVRRFMNTLEHGLRVLRQSTATPVLDDLEDKVWGRVREARAVAAVERRWRAAQMLAAVLALATGIALGGAEATAVLRTQLLAASLTTPALAPSELLEGHG
jgi:hypothetical protein